MNRDNDTTNPKPSFVVRRMGRFALVATYFLCALALVTEIGRSGGLFQSARPAGFFIEPFDLRALICFGVFSFISGIVPVLLGARQPKEQTLSARLRATSLEDAIASVTSRMAQQGLSYQVDRSPHGALILSKTRSRVRGDPAQIRGREISVTFHFEDDGVVATATYSWGGILFFRGTDTGENDYAQAELSYVIHGSQQPKPNLLKGHAWALFCISAAVMIGHILCRGSILGQFSDDATVALTFGCLAGVAYAMYCGFRQMWACPSISCSLALLLTVATILCLAQNGVLR